MKSKAKASVFTTVSLIFFLFYGAIARFFSTTIYITSKGAIVSAFIFLLLFILFIVIKKSRKELIKLTIYFNLLFLLLVATELPAIGVSIFRPHTKNKSVEGIHSRNQKRFPVYLVVLDEYAGAETLNKYGFSNERFLSALSTEGFHVVKNAVSNYSNTVPSMASLLNFNYIQLPANQSPYQSESYISSLVNIKNNRVVEIFQKNGYKIFNYSPFVITSSSNQYHSRFVPSEIALLFSITIFDDLIDLAPPFFARRVGNDKMLSKLLKGKIRDNFRIIENVVQETARQDSGVAFYYLHLMMPHSPFATDSSGNVNVAFFKNKNLTQKDKNEAYLQYLVYTNKVIVDFIKRLKSVTKGEAVIILMSDHGSRDLAIGLNGNESFNSLNCIYVPGGITMRWHDSISHVNQFRILFNEMFNEKLPLLKDSLVLE